METYICLLRGINVSGQKIIKMEDLRKMFEALGFKNPQTYIQSGNVVFQSKKENCDALPVLVSKNILKTFGHDVPVLVKEAIVFENIIKGNLFLDDRSKDQNKMHVTFLAETPDEATVIKIKEGNFGTDEFIIIGSAIYLYCPNGYGNTKLSNTFFESKLKVKATTRNLKTVNELIKIALGQNEK